MYYDFVNNEGESIKIAYMRTDDGSAFFEVSNGYLLFEVPLKITEATHFSDEIITFVDGVNYKFGALSLSEKKVLWLRSWEAELNEDSVLGASIECAEVFISDSRAISKYDIVSGISCKEATQGSTVIAYGKDWKVTLKGSRYAITFKEGSTFSLGEEEISFIHYTDDLLAIAPNQGDLLVFSKSSGELIYRITCPERRNFESVSFESLSDHILLVRSFSEDPYEIWRIENKKKVLVSRPSKKERCRLLSNGKKLIYYDGSVEPIDWNL